VKAAMDSDLPPIPGAVLPINFNAYSTVQKAILLDRPQFTNVLDTTSLFSRTRHPYVHGESREQRGVAEVLNTTFNQFTMEDTLTWFLSPVAWRDDAATAVAMRFLRDHQLRLRVNLKRALRNEGLLQVLERTSSVMEGRGKVFDRRETMLTLETLHKSIVLYMWMRQRMPVVFPDLEEALVLKERTEKAMEFVLQIMTKQTSVEGKKADTLADRRS
jgi:ATP-dependent RNA helicase SUPV3L1/SUV3